MAKSATIAQSYSSGDTAISTSKVYTSGKKISIDEPVASGAVDQEHALVLDVTQVKAIIIRCDQDMTLNFNSVGSPDPQIVMLKDVPYLWTTDSYDSLLLTSDVTKVFVTNDSSPAAAGSFQLDAIVDPTV